MSIRAFAKKVGLSESMIRKAIGLGKITLTSTETGKGILYESGLREMEEFAIGASKKVAANTQGAAIPKNAPTSKATNKSQQDWFPTDEDDVPLFADSKSRNEFYKSELLKLELEERKETLVQKDAVYLELFEFGTEVKSSILAIPERITDQLISLSGDRNAFHTLLTDSLSQVLDLLSKYTPETC